MAYQGHFSLFLMKWVLVLVFVMFIANIIMIGGIKSFFLTHSADSEVFEAYYEESLHHNRKHLRADEARDLFEYHKDGIDSAHKRLNRHQKLERLRSKYQEGIKKLNETPGMSDIVKGHLAAQKIKGLHNIDRDNLDSDLEFHKAGKKHGREDKKVKHNPQHGQEGSKKKAMFDVHRKTRANPAPSEINSEQRNYPTTKDTAKNRIHKRDVKDTAAENSEKHLETDRKTKMQKKTKVKQGTNKKLTGKILDKQVDSRKLTHSNGTFGGMDSPCYMTINPPRGQLGNQLFQFASLIGLAHKQNCIPFIHPLSEFNISPAFVLPQTLYKDMSFQQFYTISSMNTETSNGIESTKYRDYTEFSQYKNWTLDGYFQSYRYFENVTNDLTKYLMLKDSAVDTAMKFLTNVPLKHVKVGIHVRLKDYISSFQLSLGRVAATPEYLQKAMKFYQDQHALVTFIVISDDIPWCKEHLYNSTKNIIFSPFSDPGLDLAVMKLCDHSIITVGTFGWWGAWLCGGDVVYYDGYPRPRSKMDRQFVKQDYYPKHWVGML